MNIAYIMQPKFKDPFTNLWQTNYFVPSVEDQQGKEWNYIIVTCSPEWNGIWRYPAQNTKNYKQWKNKTKPCYYVPIKDCILFKNLKDLKNPEIIDKIIDQQEKWWKGEIKHHPMQLNGRPKWMLKNVN